MPFKIALIALTLLTVFFQVGLTTQAFADKLKIGVILPLSGPCGAYGALVKNGISSVDTSDVELIFEDDRCEPANSVTSFLRLAEVDGVKLFLGPVPPGGSLAVAPKIARKNLVSIGLCTGSERAYKLSHGRIFLPQYSAESDARFNAKKMYEIGVRKPAILFWEQELPWAHEHAFRAAFPGKVAATIAFPTLGKDEVRAAVLKLKATDFDAVYVPIYEPFLFRLMSEMRHQGLLTQKVFSIYSAQNPEVLQVEGKFAEGLIFSAPAVSTDLPLPSYFAKLGTEVMLDTARKCAGDPECVRVTLEKDKRFVEGALQSGFELRTVRGGEFKKLE